jgi:hypothetical protein
VWYGNSDSSSPNLGLLRYSMDNAGQTWVAFVKEYMNNKPNPTFKRPKGVVVGAGSELYIQGTQPGGARQVDSGSPPVSSSTSRSGSSTSGSDDDDGGSVPRRGGGNNGGGNNGGGNNGGGNNGGGNNGGGNDGGGGPGPAPTCRPGSTNKPPGCVIPIG